MEKTDREDRISHSRVRISSQRPSFSYVAPCIFGSVQGEEDLEESCTAEQA